MDAQDIILGSRVAHVRELKAEVARLKAENARLRDESEAVSAHFDLALLAAEDLRTLPEGGRLVIVDGWNAILGSGRTAHSREELVAKAKAHVAERPADLVWIVLDGPRPSVVQEGRVRVSYTGGRGAHRADKFVCDFVRMAAYRGAASRIEVVTADKSFREEVRRLQAVPADLRRNLV